MSKLTSLLAQVDTLDSALASDLREQVQRLSKLREFGLNFEQHVPETVELCGRAVRRGDKVRKLPPRGDTTSPRDKTTYRVQKVSGAAKKRTASLVLSDGTDAGTHPVEDLVVVADFRDPIYPGLKSTGKVEQGGDKPYHAVINAENFHALEALVYTYEGKVDCIYIDPPYNTRDKDWKYNNDYVDGDDEYKHSKWLSMMERRLALAKKLLNPIASVLIVTIDEKEYLRLGLLLEQSFPGSRIQMVTAVINPRAGVARPDAFTRTDEYIYCVQIGDSAVGAHPLSGEDRPERNTSPIWFSLMRTGSNSSREARPNLFYPIWVTQQGELAEVGEPIPLGAERAKVKPPKRGLSALWPLRPDGTENTWQLGAPAVRQAFRDGEARVRTATGRTTVSYLRAAEKRRIAAGEIEVLGRDETGALKLRHKEGAVRVTRPRTVWNSPAHDAGLYGSSLLRALIPNRSFPFPKSLYAVEDTLRFFLADKPQALVIDFFAGSGTTAHAVMRLNRQDGGRRQAIVVTNNEVSADEATKLTRLSHRQGDEQWEALGICELITKPRIRAAITGLTPDGEPVAGDYKFADEFPMAEGFPENVEFFDLTYEDPDQVRMDMAFAAVAPLLWLLAGSRGRRIDAPTSTFDIADTYGVLFDLDSASGYIEALEAARDVKHAFIVADDEVQFQAIAAVASR